MNRGDLYKLAKDACSEYEDGELGVSKCCSLYCEDRGLSEDLAEAMAEAYYYEEAIGAGIPEEVVKGNKKLTDYFSQEYIDYKCGRTK